MNPVRAIIADQVRLYRHKDGGWLAAYRELTGRRRMLRLTGARTEREARTMALKVQRSFDATPALRDPEARLRGQSPTLAEWFQTWSAEASIGTRTMASYRQQWGMLMAQFGPASRLSDLDPDACAKWAKGLETGRELISARGILGRCKSLLREAVAREMLHRNPLERVKTGLPIVDREWVYTNRQDAAALIGAAPRPAVALLLALCRWGGLRPGEARRMLWSDYEPASQRITVRPSNRVRTSKDRLRIVPACPELATLLALHQATGRVVVGARVALDDSTRQAFELSGVAPDPRTPLHSLRRSRATDLLADGLDVPTVARIQGDSAVVVMRFYHLVTPAAEASITGLVAPVLRPAVSPGRSKVDSAL